MARRDGKGETVPAHEEDLKIFGFLKISKVKVQQLQSASRTSEQSKGQQQQDRTLSAYMRSAYFPRHVAASHSAWMPCLNVKAAGYCDNVNSNKCPCPYGR